MRKQIAAFEFRNGGFGLNRGSIARVANGYVVNHGVGADGCFYQRAVDAKRAYRDTVAQRAAERDFSPLDRFGDRVLAWSL